MLGTPSDDETPTPGEDPASHVRNPLIDVMFDVRSAYDLGHLEVCGIHRRTRK